jgi:hypothetical protein
MASSERDTSPTPDPVSRRPEEASPPWGALAVAVGSALAAGATGHLVGGTPGWVAVAVVALLGGAVALLFVKGPSVSHDATQQGGEADGGKSRGAALLELEAIRRQIALATTTLRGGRDPLAVVAELGMGPLNGLLQAVRDAGTTSPVVSRIAIDEAELVGTDGEPLPEPWPADADSPPAFDPRIRAEALRGVDALIAGLETLSRDLARPVAETPTASGTGQAARTAAQLVDDVVHTAADGIEDLAAGLMRANELASVAERVTNRATLLALNAALEATRSGSEAFAAIAEETRRLAEFAREATDTISRLANEIEYKVGETITAIHSTSEDAKVAVAALSGATPLATVASPKHRDSVAALLDRARAVRKSLTATLPSRGAGKPRSGSGGSDDGEAHQAALPAPEVEEAEPMREVPPPIEMASDLAPDTAAPPSGEETPAEHVLLLERLKPEPGIPG